ncbi:transmembrane protease serine 13-like [Mercenaria mercenaria]|uniref:transmembrane protease serine 13-like n=1 Tax=Mercenaria mercenaria TaxID=6596 RepID=UPI00234EB84B|nr:transmembrane protease serine 13-like [Mercenaria mercenaria]
MRQKGPKSDLEDFNFNRELLYHRLQVFKNGVIVSSKRSDVVSGRIKGGLDVVKGDLSFITKITKNGKHVCNGAHVDRRWLLTVRDCINEKRLSQYKVYFKPMDSKTVPMNLVRTIRKIVVPSTGPQDIVLARLNKKLKRKEDNVRPFDRFSFQEIEPKLIRCKTVGFSPNGKLLNEIDITTDSAERCRVTSETDTCPFDIVGGKEDNGSPIICKLDVTNDKKWYLAGLTAIDNGCVKLPT